MIFDSSTGHAAPFKDYDIQNITIGKICGRVNPSFAALCKSKHRKLVLSMHTKGSIQRILEMQMVSEQLSHSYFKSEFTLVEFALFLPTLIDACTISERSCHKMTYPDLNS
jgi:hypothetical protein